MVGIQKMEKKQGEEFVKGLKNEPIVSSIEFVDLMVVQSKNLNQKKISSKFELITFFDL